MDKILPKKWKGISWKPRKASPGNQERLLLEVWKASPDSQKKMLWKPGMASLGSLKRLLLQAWKGCKNGKNSPGRMEKSFLEAWKSLSRKSATASFGKASVERKHFSWKPTKTFPGNQELLLLEERKPLGSLERLHLEAWKRFSWIPGKASSVSLEKILQNEWKGISWKPRKPSPGSKIFFWKFGKASLGRKYFSWNLLRLFLKARNGFFWKQEKALEGWKGCT